MLTTLKGRDAVLVALVPSIDSGGFERQSRKGGHFFPEENPDNTAVLVKPFLSV